MPKQFRTIKLFGTLGSDSPFEVYEVALVQFDDKECLVPVSYFVAEIEPEGDTYAAFMQEWDALDAHVRKPPLLYSADLNRFVTTQELPGE